LPRDSNTTKRPFPLIEPANDSELELVSCPKTESNACELATAANANTTINMNVRLKRSFTNSSKRHLTERAKVRSINNGKVQAMAQKIKFYALNKRSASKQREDHA
jgi:hypothetical protein